MSLLKKESHLKDDMMTPKYVVAVLLLVSLIGCATSKTPVGMSKDNVKMQIAAQGFKIIHQNENAIIVTGVTEKTNEPAMKTYKFKGDKLVSVDDKVLEPSGK